MSTGSLTFVQDTVVLSLDSVTLLALSLAAKVTRAGGALAGLRSAEFEVLQARPLHAPVTTHRLRCSAGTSTPSSNPPALLRLREAIARGGVGGPGWCCTFRDGCWFVQAASKFHRQATRCLAT